MNGTVSRVYAKYFVVMEEEASWRLSAYSATKMIYGWSCLLVCFTSGTSDSIFMKFDMCVLSLWPPHLHTFQYRVSGDRNLACGGNL